MINSKKRSAEKPTTLEEPSKKKTYKDKKENTENVKKTSKFEKPLKPKGKFAGKDSKTDDGKKFQHRANNKFAGKPKFGEKTNKFGTNKFAGKGGETKGPVADEKTDWRKFKQDKKDLKLKRKQSKDSYEISIEAKQIYEKLKCRKTEDKAKLAEKLFNLINTGDVIKKIIMAHDTARIIQCMLKFAAPAVREQLSERLMPMAVEMSTSKYAHFCVLRMFKYGSPATKTKLVDSIFGNVVKLACHVISNKILDHVYLSVANPKQKIYMRQEFYGDLYKKSKDDNVKCLKDCYKDTSNMKASILSSVKSNLEHVANKNLVDNSLVHSVMLEYVREMDEDKIEETVSMFAPLIPLMLTTKDGSQASIICFYQSTPKNRRAIIKTIKEHLVKICTHEHGHIFAIAVLNSLDDTKAIKKAIYDAIHPELKTLMANQWGRRVIDWLISPADTNCFHPTFIQTIDEGLKFGKKDKDIRRKEIFEQIEEPIATAIAEDPAFWVSDKHIGLVTAKILEKLSSSNFKKAASALAEVIAKDDWTVSVEDESTEKKSKKPQDVEKIIAAATKLKTKQRKQAKNAGQEESVENKEEQDEDESDEEAKEEENKISVLGIEEAGSHFVLKKIIKHDKERIGQDKDHCTFGSLLVQQLTEETLKKWIKINRACFILLNIVENNSEEVSAQLKNLLSASDKKTLKQQKFNGAQLLLKKLN